MNSVLSDTILGSNNPFRPAQLSRTEGMAEWMNEGESPTVTPPLFYLLNCFMISQSEALLHPADISPWMRPSIQSTSGWQQTCPVFLLCCSSDLPSCHCWSSCHLDWLLLHFTIWGCRLTWSNLGASPYKIFHHYCHNLLFCLIKTDSRRLHDKEQYSHISCPQPTVDYCFSGVHGLDICDKLPSRHPDGSNLVIHMIKWHQPITVRNPLFGFSITHLCPKGH